MNKAIDLSRYPDVLVTLSATDRQGKSGIKAVEPGDSKFDSDIQAYKYMKFSPAPHVAQIGDHEYIKLRDAFLM